MYLIIYFINIIYYNSEGNFCQIFKDITYIKDIEEKLLDNEKLLWINI